uniref:Uncharacterized protein n=1 Tax=Anguilla anguilla TaxID=7936 RepID=A0A0E9WQW1_ANGAN
MISGHKQTLNVGDVSSQTRPCQSPTGPSLLHVAPPSVALILRGLFFCQIYIGFSFISIWFFCSFIFIVI